MRTSRWGPLALVVAIGGCAHRPVPGTVPIATGPRDNAALEQGDVTLDDGWHLDPIHDLLVFDTQPDPGVPVEVDYGMLICD